jgi:hypothetical protein
MVLCYNAWKRIGASTTVLQWISEGIQIQFVVQPGGFFLPNHVVSKDHVKFVDSEIKELLNADAIAPCLDGLIQLCVSPCSCISKKLCKLRLVVDLRVLNLCIAERTFQNEGIDIVAQLVEPNDRLCSIDLKNGYHHVKIHSHYQKYLGIKWRNRYYVWRVLPFGLRCGSYFFCKTVHAAIQYLHEQHLRVCAYVDDKLLMVHEKLFTDHKDYILLVFDELGFNINFNINLCKSEF